MTLVNLPFDILASKMLARFDKGQEHSYFGLIAKFTNILLSLVYLCYDAGKYWECVDDDFVRFVIGMAFLSEVFLIIYEVMNWCAITRRVVPEETQVKAGHRCLKCGAAVCGCWVCAAIIYGIVQAATGDSE